MNDIRFSCTRLDNTNKVGKLPRDSDGYYDMVVGGLNVFNSAGQYYEYEGAKALFEGSSAFMRRIKRGALLGEMGHPVKSKAESDDEYLDRIYGLNPANICVHHKEIYLDFDSIKDDKGRPVVAIRSKLAPSGPMGTYLAQALENKSQNVCFSIRSLTHDNIVRGRYTRTIKHVVTFDWVTEPGIAFAEKFMAPSLESIADQIVTENQLKRVCGKAIQHEMATESSVMMARELLSVMGWEQPVQAKPAFANW